MPPDDEVIRTTMLDLLAATRQGSTICPSQVARRLEREERDWRALMPRVRECAHALAREGRLEVTQRGVVLSPQEDWRGALRLRRPIRSTYDA
jgi:Protein of unknown function (DUF3253)